MKVGVFLSDAIDPSIGGNFSYHQKFVDAVDQYNFDSQIEICFVGRVNESKMKLRKDYLRISSRFLYQLFRVLDKLGITQFFLRLINFNVNLANKYDHRILKKNGIDILLYPKQFLKEVDGFPFVSMNWDAGHKSTFAFPELLSNFDQREHWYSIEVQKALAIFLESESSKDEFVSFYAIPENKIFVIPLFAGGMIDQVIDQSVQDSILNKFNLKREQYFYYPAQFWAHKNHYNLLLAFKKLIEKEKQAGVKLIFSGSDQGNKPYIEAVIAALELGDFIDLLGFISNEEVFALCNNALALTMPTFLGPTNMPLIEARHLHTAVICSDLHGHREICQDGAVYVNPTDIDGWVEAMKIIMDETFRKELIAKADRVMNHSPFKIETAILKLEEALINLINIRRTFR